MNTKDANDKAINKKDVEKAAEKAVKNKNRRNRRSKPGKPNQKPMSGKSDTVELRPNDFNDFSWYNHYPELTEAVGRVPYPYRPGMTLKTNNVVVPDASVDSALGDYRIPGVMSLMWVPSIGQSSNPTDPASIIGAEIYAQVRHAYSGQLDADGPDFVIYMLALDSIYSYIGSLKRIYRILNAWGPMNYVVPNTLLTSLGVSIDAADELRRNKADFWKVINELTHMSRRFTCPAIMDIMNRHYWMNDNVYTDANSQNAQMYCFNQYAFYQYTDTNPDNPGLYLSIAPWYTNTAITVQVLFEFGRTLINSLANWDDSYTINGYLQRAFEGTNSFTVALLEEGESFGAVYEPEVLAQIENSKTIPGGFALLDSGVMSWYSASTPVITQNVLNNSVVATYPIKVTAAADSYLELHARELYSEEERFLLSSRSDQPTVQDNIIATRLKACIIDLDRDSTGNFYVGRIQCATEIPMCWLIRQTPVQTQAGILGNGFLGIVYPQLPTISDEISLSITTNDFPQMLRMMCLASQFDWCPLSQMTFYCKKGPFATDATSYREIIGDIHNTTVVGLELLQNIHKVCIYSELNAFRV